MTEMPELIPRKMLFGNPERTEVRLSHDGTRIAYLAPVDGVLNVWVAPVDAIEEARPVTQDTDRGIRMYVWTYNPGYLVYVQDRGGDEDWHVYAVDVETEETTDLTPYEGVHAYPVAMSDRFPDEVLAGINRRDPQLHDIYRVNILTRESKLVVENDFGAVYIMSDDDFNPRLARVTTPDGGGDILAPSESGEWKTVMSIGPEDDLTTSPRSFDEGGRILYMFDSRGRDTSALVALDTETWETTELAIDPRADASDAIAHPVTGVPQAVAFEYDRASWKVLDEAIAADLERIADDEKGEFDVGSRSLDDRRWVVRYERDAGPKTYLPVRARHREAGVPVLGPAGPGGGIARPDAQRGHKVEGWARPGRLLLAAGRLGWARPTTAPRSRCQRCCWSTAGPGAGTAGATILYTSSWRTGAMRSSA